MGYVFDPERLHEIAKTGVGLPFDEMNRTVIDGLVQAYPDHIDPDPKWVFNLAGNATGYMAVLHGSLSEYLILFGTPIGTEGFSGRYALDIYDFVLTGEMWTYTEDRFGEKVVTRPGEGALLRKGTVKGWRAPDGLWMLEYGRGLIPTSLPVALTDSLWSAIDPEIIAKTFWIYGRLVLKELLQGKV